MPVLIEKEAKQSPLKRLQSPLKRLWKRFLAHIDRKIDENDQTMSM